MKRPITVAIIGGAIVASAVAAMRLAYFKNMKSQLDSIPYEKEKPFNWKHFFRNY